MMLRGGDRCMRTETDCRQPGRRYLEKQKKRRKRRKVLLLCFLSMAMIAGIFLIAAEEKEKQEQTAQLHQEVYASELAGYLQAAYLTPEETRKLVIPKVRDVLTVTDLQQICSVLGVECCYEEAVMQLQNHFSTTDSTSVNKNETIVSRAQWCMFYELLLDTLQVKDTVTEVEVQYLGKVPGEQCIIADNGNYDCDLQSCRMEYGKHYVVYVQGKLLLGIKQEEGQTDAEEGKTSEETASGNSAGMKVGLITIPETVRVLLTQDHGQKPERAGVYVLGSTTWKASASGVEAVVAAQTAADCGTWMAQNGVDEAVVEATDGGTLSLTDAGGAVQGTYAGKLHIYRKADGNTYWIVNELGMEDYLCGVVPGEMPASFAPEALKAQAVCARTYAALQVLGTAYEMYHADVDDTTDCQVYLPGNANAAATEAVYATAGQILTWQGMIASVYYFSTSCGYTTGLEVWQQEALPYLGVHSLVQNEGMGSSADIFLRDGQVTAYDSESRFFRWRAVLQLAGNEQKLRHALQTAASHRDGKVVLTDGAGVQTENLTSFGTLADLGIDARSESGCVTDLRLTFENGIAHVYNENAIRNILWSICTTLTDKNGNSAHNFHMLPSAFFSVDTEEHGIYVLYGGGLGHGIGMSQYGADGMAKSGKGYVEILGTFFPGTELYTGAGE